MSGGTREAAPRGAVLVLSSNLTVCAFVQGAALQVGGDCLQVADADALLRRLADVTVPAIVLVDLEAPGLDIARLVSALSQQANSPRAVIAFGPHVHEQRLHAARDAGCTVVLTRGKFYAQAAEILASYLPVNASS